MKLILITCGFDCASPCLRTHRLKATIGHRSDAFCLYYLLLRSQKHGIARMAPKDKWKPSQRTSELRIFHNTFNNLKRSTKMTYTVSTQIIINLFNDFFNEIVYALYEHN